MREINSEVRPPQIHPLNRAIDLNDDRLTLWGIFILEALGDAEGCPVKNVCLL